MRKLMLAVAMMAAVYLLLSAGNGSILGQATTPTPTPSPTATVAPGPSVATATYIVSTVGSDLNSCQVPTNPSPALAGPAAIPTLTISGITTSPPPVSPQGGPSAGGTTVAITGSGFVGNSQVFFGFTPATSVQVVNGQLIYAVAPPGALGSTVSVVVQNPQALGQTASSGTQSVSFGAPTVTGITPSGGPVTGGYSILITGSNFLGATSVSFTPVPPLVAPTLFAPTFNVISDSQILATVPTAPLAGGTYDVQVTTPPPFGATSATSPADRFTFSGTGPPPPAPTVPPVSISGAIYVYGFNPMPVVAQIFPNAGPSAGGTVVTIRGWNFENNATVTFGVGGTPATNVTVVNGYEILATAPPGTGAPDVIVTNPGGFDAMGPKSSAATPFDVFTYGGVATTPATPPTPIEPTTPPQGPCGTIQGAVNLTRDRDGVDVEIGTYVIDHTIEVNHIIAVTGVGFEQQDCKNKLGLNKIVLRSANGDPIFHITSTGSGVFGTLIAGFIMGGNTSFKNPGAIQLDGDAYTEVRCNLIGQEDLPNVAGILLKDSDHAFIHDNQIQGSSQFPISPVLSPSAPVGGFGIASGECLGAPSRSDSATIQDNLFAFNSNAGIYLCSDSSGGEIIKENSIRDNGRGIVLQDTNDIIANTNFIQDNYYDGVEVLGSSENNSFDTNTIDSQNGPNSTGVSLQGDGILFPLGNIFSNNQIRRNTINVFVAGARGTRFSSNFITADGDRTDFVFALGNPGGAAINSANPDFAQPSSTLIRSNILLANGPCDANTGCAVRLMAGVTTSIDATGNDWGVTSSDEIRFEIWDQFKDPALGQVVTYSQQNVPVTPTVPPTVVPTTPATIVAPPVAVSPVSIQPAAVAPTGAPAATSTPAPAATATPTATTAPVAYINPATGNYYVEVTVCVTSANGQAVPNDQLTIALFDSAGNALGSQSATTDSRGCFSGEVAAPGQSAAIQPASITVSDPSGATTNLTVTPGSPPYRPPTGTIIGGP